MKVWKPIVTLVASLLASACGLASPKGSHFDHVIITIFENTNYQDAIRQPFFASLAQRGALFSQLSAETHPSQANYFALTSGSLNGVSGDDNVDLNVNHIGDLLEAHGLTWKVYAEGYPGNCFKDPVSGDYARRHNPFISYVNVQRNPLRCGKIVSAEQFDRDAASGQLPNYAFYIPNVKNDGHDTGIAYADRWYKSRFSTLLDNSQFMRDKLLITTFDENAGENGNVIYTSFVGPMVKQGVVVSTHLNHYSLLRLIEDNWNLGTLGKQDAAAPLIPNTIWR